MHATMQMPYEHIEIRAESGVCYVSLNRPEVHNAFNRQLIAELRQLFDGLALPTEGLRAVVLAGKGKSFCAGADVNWMRESLAYSEEENLHDARGMAAMFDAINNCPLPVIARVQGAVLGGGVGLAAVCDIVVQAEQVVWAFSEVKLGIAPAVISPFVLAKIGRSQARALFLTGERFGAQRAAAIGLAHVTAPQEGIDAEVERLVREIKSSAPQAVARAKHLVAVVPEITAREATEYTVRTIAELRVSDEGQEGLGAFLGKRRPRWDG